jgi:oligopeptide/dipeptide ABC transporter ATP-binding protein
MILRLLEPTAGSVRLFGQEVTSMSRHAMRPMRRKLQIVFQDPFASLDPRMSVGEVIAEPLRHCTDLGRSARRSRVGDVLEQVGLSRSHANRYPHEFSGGQRQRIAIARALAPSPSLIVLDEPVSALDVSIQAQIISLLQDLQEALGVSYLFISHDLSVVRHLCQRIMVMYLGRIVEDGDVRGLFEQPTHPYTQALLQAVPIEHPRQRSDGGLQRAAEPSPGLLTTGCSFRDRCPRAVERCARERPELLACDDRRVACHLAVIPNPHPTTTMETQT